MSDFEVKVESDVKGTHFIFTQTAKSSKKVLDYDYKRCNGCGICVKVCPKGAIELGPVVQIATGLDAPPIIIDHTKCSFCGMCASFCPVNAITLTSDGKEQAEREEYPHLIRKVKFNEKCLPCLLCKKACREEAISVEFTFPKKEQIAPFEKGKTGEIEVDMGKCSLCGACAELCPAFVLVEKEPKPDDVMPFSDLLVDKAKCDYCGICVEFCPEKAIRVKGELRGTAPKITGIIKVDDAKCTRCGWCRKVCPYDAVELEMPFEGEIKLIDVNLKGCDPVGCHGCFNVCPAHAWYVPADKKIDVVKDFCIYCGACEKACHVFAIKTARSSVRHTPLIEAPWKKDWERAIQSLVDGNRALPDVSRAIEVPPAPGKPAQETAPVKLNHEFMEKVRKKIDAVTPALRNAGVRRAWERKNGGEVLKRLKRRKSAKE